MFLSANCIFFTEQQMTPTILVFLTFRYFVLNFFLEIVLQTFLEQ